MRCATSCNICCGTGAFIAGIAILAWLGMPAVLALASSLDLAASQLEPLLIALVLGALGLVIFGLWLGVRSHGRPEPFMVGLVGVIATAVGVLVWAPVAVLGFLTVAGSIVVSQRYLRRAH